MKHERRDREWTMGEWDWSSACDAVRKRVRWVLRDSAGNATMRRAIAKVP